MRADRLEADQLGRHAPLSLPELSDVMRGATFRWCLAGGLAVDCALGRTTREHDDLDIAVFRREENSVRDWFAAWELWGAGCSGSGLDRLDSAKPLRRDLHEIWCRRLPDEPWRLELLIEESSADEWLYRRNHRITLPFAAVICEIQGLPVMALEAVLLYKAKSPRDRDLADFNAALPQLTAPQRGWLKMALFEAHPGCRWLAEL